MCTYKLGPLTPKHLRSGIPGISDENTGIPGVIYPLTDPLKNLKSHRKWLIQKAEDQLFQDQFQAPKSAHSFGK